MNRKLFSKTAKTVVFILATFFIMKSTAMAADYSSTLPESVKAKGKIIIGINGIFPPMEFKEPGKDELIGFDVDLAKAIGQKLGIDIVFDDQKFDQLINSINTKRVDMVISGISDTEVRRKTLDFIDYFNSGTQCFTMKAHAETIKDLADLSGKTFAVSAATDYLTTMQQWSHDNLETKGREAIKILAVDSEATARLQMIQGRAQASAISPEVLGWLSKENPGQFVPVGPVLRPDPYGICFAKDNSQLRDAVYAALKELFANGTYQNLLAKWEISTGALTEPLINGQRP
ncbi:ABC transporter substrate-binding protein [Desulforhopalus singaporensis]|uniref:Polar amino acid transport system substrate-binding protein n=1 Tax=Desulforhopalus singaporensis TaxID=91360 RepID=A0A1H0RX57_9BACT|nr:ABC transporter substrate-binding protein [Desulforhopalus singaporensis]SDP34013.1 polar amino acid transport system substrate-binding protein [Desulforhopalus singaporensis]